MEDGGRLLMSWCRRLRAWGLTRRKVSGRWGTDQERGDWRFKRSCWYHGAAFDSWMFKEKEGEG